MVEASHAPTKNFENLTNNFMLLGIVFYIAVNWFMYKTSGYVYSPVRTNVGEFELKHIKEYHLKELLNIGEYRDVV